MSIETKRADLLADLPQPMPPSVLLGLLAATLAGVGLALLVLPSWAPAIAESLQGPQPHAWWYLARSSGLVGYVLLWLSMIAGLSLSNRSARVWPGTSIVFDLHQHLGLIGLLAALFHALVLLGDRHLAFGLADVLLPFFERIHAPIPVALGILALYLMAFTALTFYVRADLGHRAWRLIHFASFAAFALAWAHGVFAGTDLASPWLQGGFLVTGGIVAMLAVHRIASGIRSGSGNPGRVASKSPRAVKPKGVRPPHNIDRS